MQDKDLFGLNGDAIDAICSVFAHYPDIAKAIIYGSRAKETFTAGSDIDLTLIGDGLSLTDLLRIENELDDLLLPWKIDLSLLRMISNADLIDHVARVGKPFYIRQD